MAISPYHRFLFLAIGIAFENPENGDSTLFSSWRQV
jgi:hypothetical protein